MYDSDESLMLDDRQESHTCLSVLSYVQNWCSFWSLNSGPPWWDGFFVWFSVRTWRQTWITHFSVYLTTPRSILCVCLITYCAYWKKVLHPGAPFLNLSFPSYKPFSFIKCSLFSTSLLTLFNSSYPITIEVSCHFFPDSCSVSCHAVQVTGSSPSQNIFESWHPYIPWGTWNLQPCLPLSCISQSRQVHECRPPPVAWLLHFKDNISLLSTISSRYMGLFKWIAKLMFHTLSLTFVVVMCFSPMFYDKFFVLKLL